MNKPVAAIVGRPNVGKSSLFNALAGSKIAITDDTPGVTRDRIFAEVTWLNHTFTLIDTGGIEPESQSEILRQMREQAEIAAASADVVLFLTDVKQGLTDADGKVADMLRRLRKPVLLVVNKADAMDKVQADIYEFYALGLGDPYPVSAVSKKGLGDMLDALVACFPKETETGEADERVKIAVVGKPNVGKSSLVNRLLGENRVIVSETAGTTRDAVDTVVRHAGQEYVLIDTAGLRKKSKIKENLERYSIIRTVAAVERADVVVLLLDAFAGITEQDAKICGIAHERGKGLLIAVNKWDLIEKDNTTHNTFKDRVRQTLSYVPYAEILFISALSGQRVPKLFQEIEKIVQNQNLRVATGVLNEVLMEAVAMNQPPADKGKRLKIFYSTQVAVKPPTFVLFVNHKKLMHFSYTRYLENKLREAFGFFGTPVRFLVRERGEKE